MPLPDIFSDGSPQDEKLAAYFEEMYEYLLDEGVPEDRLPSPWHVLSRIVKCIDHDLLREWLDAYVAVEAEEVEEEEESEPPRTGPRPKPKRRPSYLRAIDNTTSENEQGDGDSAEGPQTQTDGS